jgi:pantoate--beta-alanine ligase
MEVIEEREALVDACDQARGRGATVGLVPTMGALHDGHRALIREARQRNGFVVVSIFVNPLQFGEGEDFETYPRDLDRDVAVCTEEGVEVVFAPEPEEMYPGEPHVTVDPGPVGDILEGATRPGHFRGVCTVVAKLFGLTGRCEAYFGEKDAQQVFLVARMMRDLDMPVYLSRVPTVREPDGLALSSRNRYLSSEERRAATCLHRALALPAEMVEKGERDAAAMRGAMEVEIETEPLARLDYATIVDEGTFLELETVDPMSPSRSVVAAWIGKTRLIDTMALVPVMAENP